MRACIDVWFVSDILCEISRCFVQGVSVVGKNTYTMVDRFIP